MHKSGEPQCGGGREPVPLRTVFSRHSAENNKYSSVRVDTSYTHCLGDSLPGVMFVCLYDLFIGGVGGGGGSYGDRQ